MWTAGPIHDFEYALCHHITYGILDSSNSRAFAQSSIAIRNNAAALYGLVSMKSWRTIHHKMKTGSSPAGDDAQITSSSTSLTAAMLFVTFPGLTGLEPAGVKKSVVCGKSVEHEDSSTDSESSKAVRPSGFQTHSDLVSCSTGLLLCSHTGFGRRHSRSSRW